MYLCVTTVAGVRGVADRSDVSPQLSAPLDVADAFRNRRRAAGLPLGRPKGKLNKTLKLDKYRKEIQKYLDLNISKASIAKLIKCHPQTLYNYMEKRSLKPRKEAETA